MFLSAGSGDASASEVNLNLESVSTDFTGWLCDMGGWHFLREGNTGARPGSGDIGIKSELEFVSFKV